MIEFWKVDRICYLLALVSLVDGIAVGIALIWGPKGLDVLGKVAGTAALLFVGSIVTLFLNRSMKGRRGE